MSGRLTETRADVLTLIADGKHIGDYVPRYKPGARRGRGAFPVTIAARAVEDLIRMGLLSRGPDAVLVLTESGRAEVARLRSVNRSGHVLWRNGAVVAKSRTVEAAHRASRRRDLVGSTVGRDHVGVQDRDLGLTEVTEAGHCFATGVPVTFTFIHNTEKAPRARGSSDQFQQRVEPAGYYVLVEDLSTIERPPTRGWIRGETSFVSPIVLLWNDAGGGYDDRSWKARLSRAYGGKRGAALSRAIRRAGYDGIVTVRDGATSEVVDLTRVGESAMLNRVGNAPVAGYVVRARKTGRYLIWRSEVVTWDYWDYMSNTSWPVSEEREVIEWVLDPDKASLYETEAEAAKAAQRVGGSEVVPVASRDYR